MSVRTILEAAVEAGFDSKAPPQWTALVVLVEMDSGGNPASVRSHFTQARKYPDWSAGDLARTAPRILIRTPAVTAEMVRLGIEATPDVAQDAAAAITEPIVAVAREPLRVLKWLTDPGTQIRIAKVVIGAALIVIGVALATRPYTERVASQVMKVAEATPQGRGAKAATAVAGSGTS